MNIKEAMQVLRNEQQRNQVKYQMNKDIYINQ